MAYSIKTLVLVAVLAAMSSLLLCSAAPPPPWMTDATTAPSTEPTTDAPTPETPETLDTLLRIHQQDDDTEVEQMSIPVAFHIQLGGNLTVRRQEEIELHDFSQLKPGHFARGEPSFEAFTGSFTAPRSGIYSFTALVNFVRVYRNQIALQCVTVSICINDDCEDNAALQTTSGITCENFGIVVTGVLEVQRGQRVSVFIQNGSERRLTVGPTTSFMGHFLGD